MNLTLILDPKEAAIREAICAEVIARHGGALTRETLAEIQERLTERACAARSKETVR